ncbi:related to Rho1 guanine nucleotide exchange factor TUS1 [Zygosaccharomyces bailii]|nr:related to Rho1 guanine nucleotide exchange factor TUS1 [Zygosaccharomyces bailii]
MGRNGTENHANVPRSSRGREHRISLPKLPPLDTRYPFLDDSDSNTQEDMSIGWTPVSDQQQLPSRQLPALPPEPVRSLSKLSKAESFSSSPTRSSGSLKKHRNRRPPPPVLSGNLASPNSPYGVSSPSALRSARVSNFMGELEFAPTPTSFYNKPPQEVLDSDITSRSGSSRHLSTKRSNESLPFISFDNTDYSTRALPPLPATNSENARSNPEDSSDFYKKLAPPQAAGARIASTHSKFSDSIGSYYSDSHYAFNNSTARNSSFNSLLGGKPLDLAPSITAPTQPFTIDSLDESKLYQCYSVYRLSDIYEWILKVYFEWFNEYVFGKIEFFQMVQLLLEFQMPKNFDQDTIDSNVDRIIESLVVQGAVRFDLEENEEISIIIGGLDVSGIFTQLLPCYSFLDSAYNSEPSTQCYSTTCVSRSISDARPEIKLSEIINKSVGLWTDYWKLTPEELAEINPREVQKQSYIFDLIILEERSMNMANAAVEIYGARFDPNLLPDEPEFASYAFDVFYPLIQLHKEYLLSPIFWKLKTKGKFIDGVGKIYLKWCNEAREYYIKYAIAMATVHEVILWEKQHGTRFAQWLKEIDNSPEVTRSKMYHDVIFFGGFFKSLQNLPITLSSILKNTEPSAEDYEYLKLVIPEVEKLSADVDRAHGTAIDHRGLVRFAKQLIIRQSENGSYVNVVNSANSNLAGRTHDRLDLGLTDPEKKIMHSGTVFKKREMWLDTSPLFIVLLDNYFLITEFFRKGNQDRFKLVERPIPIDYLNLEQRRGQDMPGSASTSTRESSFRENKQTVHTPIMAVRPHLISAATTMRTIYSSDKTLANSMDTNTTNTGSVEYSFKIRNTATSESFTFFTPTLQEYQSWINALMECFKSNRSSSRAFDLHVLSTQFGYTEKEAPVNLPVAPEGSEIDVALKKYEAKLSRREEAEKELWVTPTTIFCSTDFEIDGKKFRLIATDDGILIRHESSYKTIFVKLIQMNCVRQMEINAKLGLLFVLDDKLLCYFSVSSILGAYYDPKKYAKSNHLVGVVIKDKVGYFKLADDFGNSKHLFYERKNKIVVLTPEFDRITRLLKYFKKYKEYRLPSSASGLLGSDVEDIVVFKKSFILCTSKGTILYHDTFNDDGIVLPNFLNDTTMLSYVKQGHSSSNLFKAAIESSSKKDMSKQKMAEYVKKDIATVKTKTKTCFQIANSKNFLLIYDEAVIKVNRQGEMEDWTKDILVLNFYCTGACFHEGYLILVGDNLIQIYKVTDSEVELTRLIPVQIIKGKKVKLLNSSKTSNPVFVLSHPQIANRQLLLTCSPCNPKKNKH